MPLNTATDTDDQYANVNTSAATIAMAVDTYQNTHSKMFICNTIMATSVSLLVILLVASTESAAVSSNLLLDVIFRIPMDVIDVSSINYFVKINSSLT